MWRYTVAADMELNVTRSGVSEIPLRHVSSLGSDPPAHHSHSATTPPASHQTVQTILITFKALHNRAPSYISDLIHMTTPVHSLRSSSSPAFSSPRPSGYNGE